MSKPRLRAQRAASAASAAMPGVASSSTTSRPSIRRSAATWSRTKTPRPGASGVGPMSETTSARIRRRAYAASSQTRLDPSHLPVQCPPRQRPRREAPMGYRIMGRAHALAITLRDGTRGQGTVEYVGLILLISFVLLAVVKVGKGFDGKDIAGTIVSK